MKSWYRTTMGGTGSRFKTTQWSLIFNGKTRNETRRRLILNNLADTYWKPVYCYLRGKGFDNDDSKDLTQGFFSEIVLGRDLVQAADQSKGRFRSFLLVALERYVVSTLRYEGRMRRGGRVNIVHMEASDLANLDVSDFTPDPNRAFCYAWVSNLLDQVLMEIKEEYCSTQRAGHWEVFRLKVLAPLFEDTEVPSHREICERCHITDESKVANMIVTVKRRFRSVFRRILRDLSSSEADADHEFGEILEILSK